MILLSLGGCGASVGPADGARPSDATTLPDGTGPRDVHTPTDAAAVCTALEPTTVRAPRVARSGELIPVAAPAPSAGCGCRLNVGMRGPQQYDLRVCDCSNDPCVDPGYVSNWDDMARTVVMEPSTERLSVGSMSVPITRLPPQYMCFGGQTSINSVMIETDNNLQRSGPRRVWAFVTGTVLRCADQPLVLVETRGTNPIFLEPRDCNNSDCDGPTRPVPFAVWVMLGNFEPGMHSIFYSPGISQSFEVQ